MGIFDNMDQADVFEKSAYFQPGRYIVRWMITSDIDGDDDEGAFCFHIAVEVAAEQAAECLESGERPANDSEDSNTNLIVGVIIAISAVVITVGGGVLWLGRSK